MYLLYLGSMLCPVAPSKIQTKIGSTNKVVTLINEGQISLLKEPSLTEISFELLIPNQRYSFATYKSDYLPAAYYLDFIEDMKKSKNSFTFMIVRKRSGGMRINSGDGDLRYTSMSVSLEDYTITEDTSRGGLDYIVSIRLRQYNQHGTKTYRVVNNTAVRSSGTPRQTSNSPAPKKSNKTHTVARGDTLWGLARLYYGDGSKYTKIAEANRISDPNSVPIGTRLIIPV